MISFRMKHRMRLVGRNHQRFPLKKISSSTAKVLIARGHLTKPERVVEYGRERFCFPRNFQEFRREFGRFGIEFRWKRLSYQLNWARCHSSRVFGFAIVLAEIWLFDVSDFQCVTLFRVMNVLVLRRLDDNDDDVNNATKGEMRVFD